MQTSGLHGRGHGAHVDASNTAAARVVPVIRRIIIRTSRLALGELKKHRACAFLRGRAGPPWRAFGSRAKCKGMTPTRTDRPATRRWSGPSRCSSAPLRCR